VGGSRGLEKGKCGTGWSGEYRSGILAYSYRAVPEVGACLHLIPAGKSEAKEWRNGMTQLRELTGGTGFEWKD